MKLLIEHTAIHGVEKCFRGRATSWIDIENLLQICIQIMFSEEILLSTLLPRDLLQKSKELISEIDDTGGFLKISESEDRDAMASKVCDAAATALELDLDYLLPVSKEISDPLQLLPALSTVHLDHFARVTSALRRGDKAAIRGELSEVSLLEGNDGFLCYVISKNDGLLENLLSRTRNNDWDLLKTTKLISDVRVVLNDHIAMHSGAIYSPSVLRAREENKKFDLIVSKVMSISKEYSQKLVGPSIELPSLADVLVSQGRGDPRRVLKSALEWRQVFAPLRELIKKKGKGLSFETGEYQLAALKELNALAGILYRSASGDQPALFQSAINTNTNFSVPLPDVRSLQDWIIFKTNRKRIRAFTELSRAMLFSPSSSQYKDNILRNSMKNTGA